MAHRSWCLIFAVLCASTAVLAQDDFNFQLPKELQQFSLPLPGSPGAVAAINQSTSLGDAPKDPEEPAGQPAAPEEQADQPQEAAAAPTRPPAEPAKVSTFPPLVHGNATTNGTKVEETTEMPAETTTPKKGTSAVFYANVVLVLSGAGVLHLFN